MRKLTRRAALQGIALVAASRAGIGAVHASAPDSDPRLVLVYLRGGLDGLAAVPAYGDPHFAAARGGLAGQEPAEALKLDRLFALHGALAPLMPFYRAGELLVMPATSVCDAGRSHADAQAVLFDGDIDHGTPGWLDRTAWALSSGQFGVFTAEPGDRSLDLLADMALANPHLDISLLCPGGGAVQACAEDILSTRFASVAEQFEGAARRAALALALPRGPRVAMFELSGFDTHVAQGTVSGRLPAALDALATGLVAFAREAASVWARTAVLVVTEFGRSVAPNGQGGTDHGSASFTFLLGGGVAGGRVGAGWPRLAPDRLQGGTGLAPATDVRSIVVSVLSQHLGLPDGAVARILPGTDRLRRLTGLFQA